MVWQKWPAYEKWNLDYMKETVGDVEVPLYDSSKADPSAPINASAAKMKFADYIELIRNTPTDLRIFLFDPIKHAPKLLKDYLSPKDLMGGFRQISQYVFRGKGSVTFCILILIWRTFSIRISTEENIFFFDYKMERKIIPNSLPLMH